MNTDSEEVRELRAEIVRLRYANLELSAGLCRCSGDRQDREQARRDTQDDYIKLNEKYLALRRAIADLLG